MKIKSDRKSSVGGSAQPVHTVIAVTYQRVFLGVDRVFCTGEKRQESCRLIATHRKRTIQILARPVHYFGTPPFRHLIKDSSLVVVEDENEKKYFTGCPDPCGDVAGSHGAGAKRDEAPDT